MTNCENRADNLEMRCRLTQVYMQGLIMIDGSWWPDSWTPVSIPAIKHRHTRKGVKERESG